MNYELNELLLDFAEEKRLKNGESIEVTINDAVVKKVYVNILNDDISISEHKWAQNVNVYSFGLDRYEVIATDLSIEETYEWYKIFSGLTDEELEEYEWENISIDKEFEIEGVGRVTPIEFLNDIETLPAILWWTD